MPELKTLVLFFATAFAEIIGCYLPYLWLREGKSILLLIPAAISLSIFVWLLTLHPTAAGRVYAAYGGVYIFTAILWLWQLRVFAQRCGILWAQASRLLAWQLSCLRRATLDSSPVPLCSLAMPGTVVPCERPNFDMK